MHEMSIVTALIEMLDEQVRNHPGARVQTVHVRVGRLRQIEPSTLQFCYNAAVSGTPLENSMLEIEGLDASARCDVCNLIFTVQEHWFECPKCGSTKGALVSGNELQLTSVQLAIPAELETAARG